MQWWWCWGYTIQYGLFSRQSWGKGSVGTRGPSFPPAVVPLSVLLVLLVADPTRQEHDYNVLVEYKEQPEQSVQSFALHSDSEVARLTSADSRTIYVLYIGPIIKLEPDPNRYAGVENDQRYDSQIP